MPTRGDEIEIVPAAPEHERAILELLATALSWEEGPAGRELHRWKHRENPFGPSLEWVALAGGRVVGYRAFQRWDFDRAGERIRAVRAVDTATSPEYRGRGIFTRLTMDALDPLREAGFEFVFNTPNDQSRPGYLKMGWQVVGRLPVAGRVASLRSLVRIARSRNAEPSDLTSVGGLSPSEAFADVSPVGELLSKLPSNSRLRTRRSVDYLRWRYGRKALGYRVVFAGARPSEGMAIFRARPRGSVVAAAICELLVPEGSREISQHLRRAVTKARGVDYALELSNSDLRRGVVKLPRRGPVLTWRALRQTDIPVSSRWDLTFGDVELF